MSAGCPHRRGPRARTPARVIGMSARCPHRRALLTLCMGYRHRRALLTPARVISPSRCQQPPHDVNDPLTVPTTRVRIDNARSNSRPGRQRASTPGGTRARAGHAADTADHTRCPGGAPSPGPGILRTRPTTPAARGHARTRARPQADCSGSRTTPSEYAHKDPDLRNTHRTQGRDQALVCGPVLLNSLPCVRHREGSEGAERGRPEGSAPGPSQTRPSGGRPRRSS